MKPGEAEAILKSLVGNNQSPIFANGITINGVRYTGIRADERSFYAKKGATGVIAVKTNLAIIIGVHSENIQPGQATTVVEKLADYLIANNY